MKSKSSKTIMILCVICLIAISGFLLYYQMLYKSKTVNSNIYKLSSVFTGHKSDIWAVKFSPDGRCIASGSVDSTIKIWNLQTGAVILDLKQPEGVTYVEFSPDGKYLATGSYDEKIRMWKLPEGIMEKELVGHRGTVWSVCFSPDGKKLASSGEDAIVRLWNVSTGNLEIALKGHNLTVWDVKFSQDGQTIASGSYDKTVKIWDVKTGKNIKTLTAHTDAVVALAFSHNGTMLASTSDDKSVRIWNTRNWETIKKLHMPEHVQAVSFNPNDGMLLTGGRDKPAIGEFLQNIFGDSKINKGVSMRLWNVTNGDLLQTFDQHANDVNDVSFSANGDWIASGSSDKTIHLWHLSTTEWKGFNQ